MRILITLVCLMISVSGYCANLNVTKSIMQNSLGNITSANPLATSIFPRQNGIGSVTTPTLNLWYTALTTKTNTDRVMFAAGPGYVGVNSTSNSNIRLWIGNSQYEPIYLPSRGTNAIYYQPIIVTGTYYLIEETGSAR